MTNIFPENISKNFDHDWAIVRFDQTTDGRRWVKLIEEIDDLADNCCRTEELSPEASTNNFPAVNNFRY